ncbi:type II toxin-antitoxin system prevent-host-death family antitoxin [Klenkia sp. LSe6-5]|uniref:Antitoxin n=1 Tax=Klenkia sesuvii TaxID=3103137 RepID=A0ABU8DY11_9ACTN
MTSIGIRELRDGLSRHIAAVREGETITVTDHGTPVARIVPIGKPSAFDQLVADGVIELPTAPRRPLPDPITPADPTLRLSEQVIADRG